LDFLSFSLWPLERGDLRDVARPVSAADVRQNEAAVSGLLAYAEGHRN
jgi:hypothetical protein